MLKKFFRAFWPRASKDDPGHSSDAASSEDHERLIAEARSFMARGQIADARNLLKSVIRKLPDCRDALFGLGVLEATDRRYKISCRYFEAMAARYPGDIEAHNGLGNIQRLLGNHDAAERCYRAALAIDPGSAPVLANLGVCLKDAGRLEEALQLLDAAVAAESHATEVMLNRATVLMDLGRVDEAEKQLRLLIAEDASLAEAHTGLSQILLQDGRFAEGWDEYEWRYLGADAKRQVPYPYPWWTGEPLSDASLLIRGEQGLGDQIMFASCLPDLQRVVPHCMLECDERLVPLFARSFPAVRVFAKRPGNPGLWSSMGQVPCYQVLLSGLPRFFRRDAAAFPPHSGYLAVDQSLVADWRARLDAMGPGLKVGLSWRGGAPQTRRVLRSIPLEQWRPILEMPGVHYVSLQYGDCEDEIARVREATGVDILHCRDTIADYDKTAALVSALDLVISVQTSIVHLAGALAKPVWVAVPAVPEWRYMRRGDAMPWYATVVLFRQSSLTDWSDVMHRLGAALARYK